MCTPDFKRVLALQSCFREASERFRELARRVVRVEAGPRGPGPVRALSVVRLQGCWRKHCGGTN